jgi:hypothetical protein
MGWFTNMAGLDVRDSRHSSHHVASGVRGRPKEDGLGGKDRHFSQLTGDFLPRPMSLVRPR